MKIPLIAIIGRPNVGKSALFNRLIGRRVAIVDEMEGVTRDRSYAEGLFHNKRFILVDTGGIDRTSSDELQNQIHNQAQSALSESDIIFFVVDGRVGITEADRELAKKLHLTKKPVYLVVNKIDNASQEELQHAFYKLGFDKIFALSALFGLGIDTLLLSALRSFPEEETTTCSQKIKIAILGRPNVGKSSLLNALIGHERMIVGPTAGITRDSIEVPFSKEGKEYLLIDTAGIRRKNKERLAVEKFSAIRTQETLERADIVLLVLDAKEGFTTEERHIAAAVCEAGKGLILLMNKWDLVSGFRMEHCKEGIRKSFPYFAHLPLLFISAKENRNLKSIFPEIEKTYERWTRKIPTSLINKALAEAMAKCSPPSLMGKRLRIYYLTQVKSAPPTFLLFTNKKSLMTEGYKKYLSHFLRERLDLNGIPIRLECRGKTSPEKEES